MSTIERFEDIQAWQKARELTRHIYQVSGKGEFCRDFGLRDQIRRASVSIMSNIAEGFERSGNKEFAHFLAIAKGSAGEVRSQLYVALDAGFISAEQFAELNRLTIDVTSLLAGFLRYLTESDYKGTRFR